MNDIEKAFKVARIERGDTVQDVADNIEYNKDGKIKQGITRQYLREVIKYPDKNQKIYQKIIDYINEDEPVKQ